MKISEQQIIEKITSLLEIQYIYLATKVGEDTFKKVWIVILKGSCTSLTKELSAMVAKIFQEETDFLYRIFSSEYAEQQLKAENMFFVYGCTWDKLIYQNPDASLDVFHKYQITEKTLDKIQSNLKREQGKITSFRDGATFFIDKGAYSQAAFLLHQYIELWLRFAGLFIMEKERKSHGIKELQIYIKSYVPKLGCLFNTEIDEELNLLKLLDDAYVATRYENNYHINKEQISKIEAKANLVHTTVVYLFKTKFDVANKLLDSCKYFENQNFNKTSSDQKICVNIEKEILKKIKNYANEHFDLLKRNIYRKDVYDIHIETKGYLDTSYLTANLIKVSIMALESMEVPGQSLDAGDYAVQQVLKCVLKLIPYEEMEFMDKVRDLLLKTENH